MEAIEVARLFFYIMAQDKKSFVLYSDNYGMIKQLPDDVAGRLLKHIFSYVNDENPISDELLLNISFEPIKQSLKRDLKKFESKKEERSISGRIGNLKRWNPDLFDSYNVGNITIEEAENIAKNRLAISSDKEQSLTVAKIAVSVSDNDSVNVSDSVILLEKETKDTYVFDFRKDLISAGANKKLVSEWIKVRKTKKLTNTETALSKFLIEVEKSKYTIDEVLEKCVVNSWGGFNSEWYKKDSINQVNLPSSHAKTTLSNGQTILKSVL